MPSFHCYYCTFHFTMSSRHKHRVATDPLSHMGMRELYSSHLAPTYSLEEETFDILHTVLNFRTMFKPLKKIIACSHSERLWPAETAMCSSFWCIFAESGYNQYYPAIWFSIRPNYIAPYLFWAHTNHIHTGPGLFFMGEAISIPGATSHICIQMENEIFMAQNEGTLHCQTAWT